MISRTLAVAFISCGLAANCPGALVYELVFSIPGQDNLADARLDADPNQIFSGVEILLRETTTGTDASLLESGNLNNGGLSIRTIGADGQFRSLTADLEGVQPAPSNGPSTIAFFAFFPPGKAATDRGNGVRDVLLGTVDLVAPTAGDTTFQLQDLNPAADGDFTTFGLVGGGLEGRAEATDGGGFLNRSLTLSVTAIPEPTSASFLAFAVVGAWTTRRRRR